MSYDVNAMRAAISNVYSGNSWKWRVRNMADSQVIAVYYSFLENGKLGQRHASGSSERGCGESPGEGTDVHQLTMDELLGQA